MATEPIVVFLVHGTWAPDAPWVQADSPLYQTMQQALRDKTSRIIFRPLRWGGSNTSADRLAGAKALDAAFAKAVEEFPDARFLLVGHSHGGSVISYFWRALPDETKGRIAGAIFLSTPFIATRMAPNWRPLLAAHAAVIAIAVFTILMAIAAVVDTRNKFSETHGGEPWVTATFVGLWLAALAVAELARRLVIRWGDRVSRTLQSTIGDRETTRLRGINGLFLRATGDEAAASLAAGQFAIWAIGGLNLRWGRVVLRIGEVLSRSKLAAGLAAVVVALYALWVGGIVADITGGYFTWWDLIGARHSIPIGIFELERSTQGAVKYLSSGFSLFVLMAFGFVFLIELGILLCLAALAGAGWTSIRDGLFIELGIEPVPLGNERLHHIEWTAPTPASPLNHSHTYSDPDALQRIGDWIRETIR